MCGEQKKICEIKIWKLFMQQIRTVSPIGARCIVASYEWHRNTHLLFFCRFLYLSIFISQLSPSPHLHISLRISIYLPISISLPLASSISRIIPAPIYWRNDAPCANRRYQLKYYLYFVDFFLIWRALLTGAKCFGVPIVLAHFTSERDLFDAH